MTVPAVGASVSMTNALLAFRELLAPGTGSVNTALLLIKSRIKALDNDRAVVELYDKSELVCPLATIYLNSKVGVSDPLR